MSRLWPPATPWPFRKLPGNFAPSGPDARRGRLGLPALWPRQRAMGCDLPMRPAGSPTDYVLK